jgi:adenylosuccinate lyase
MFPWNISNKKNKSGRNRIISDATQSKPIGKLRRNLGIANAIFEHLSAKLPLSRLQRDLTDSTVLRNIGVPMGHTLIGFESTLKGLNKLLLNEPIPRRFRENWAVVAEAIQTILRREAYPNPYEALKGLTRTNEAIDKKTIHGFTWLDFEG